MGPGGREVGDEDGEGFDTDTDAEEGGELRLRGGWEEEGDIGGEEGGGVGGEAGAPAAKVGHPG